MLILRKPWTRQPQTATGINGGNPFAPGLAGYWPCNLGAAAALDQLGRNNASVNSGVSSAVSPIGRELSFDGSTGRIDFGDSPLIKPTSFTWLYSITPLSLSKSYAALIAAVESGGTIAIPVYLKSNGKLAQYLSISGSNSAVYDGTGVHTLSIGTRYRIATTYNSVTGVGSTYVNGVLDGSATMSTPGAIPLSSGTRVYFGFDAFTSGREPQCRAGNFVLLNRALTQTEVASLSREEWQLFRPRSISIPTVTAGGVSMTLSASVAVSSVIQRSTNATRLALSSALALAQKIPASTKATSTSAVSSKRADISTQKSSETTVLAQKISALSVALSVASSACQSAVEKTAQLVKVASTTIIADLNKSIVSTVVYTKTLAASLSVSAALLKLVSSEKNAETLSVATYIPSASLAAPPLSMPILLGITLSGEIVILA